MIYLLVVETDNTLTPYGLKELLETHKAIKCVNIKEVIPEDKLEKIK